MKITYTEIITIVLSSSLFASILTIFGNWWLQKTNYKKDYYKKLLDKRLEAYEEVEHLISQLSGLSQLNDGRVSPIICSLGQERFSDFLISIYVAISKATWLSDKTSRKLTELNAFLITEISNKINENADFDNQLKELGATNRNQIADFRQVLQKLLYQDLQTLHNIEKFVRRKDSYNIPISLPGKPIELQKK